MGKGDHRSKRGKIWKGSWGRRRPWRKKRGARRGKGPSNRPASATAPRR